MTDKAPDTMDKALSLGEKLLSTLEQVAVKYSEPAWEMTSFIIQSKAIYHTVGTIMLAIIWGIIVYKYVCFVIRLGKEVEDQDVAAFAAVVGLVVGGISGVALVVNLYTVVSYSNILAIVSPKLYLANKLLEKVL